MPGNTFILLRGAAVFILLSLVSGCATLEPGSPPLLLRPPEGDDIVSRNMPALLIQAPDKDYNRVGRVETVAGRIQINPDRPTVYVREETFTTPRGEYRNLIYRFHFEKVPLFPPHLTAGKNVGLIVTVTLDSKASPILYTTVHTCGCYLAFLPARTIPKEFLPPGWPADEQKVMGETLPAFVDTGGGKRLLIHLRSATHRVMAAESINSFRAAAMESQTFAILPCDNLRNLANTDQEKKSFFVNKGLRRGYVRGSHKPFEMLFMGWWALDPFIGEDKDLGDYHQTGVRFYTSLKFWARKRSDMGNFAGFLKYWGWRL